MAPCGLRLWSESLQKVDTPEVPGIVEQLSGYRRWADRRLAHVLQSTDERGNIFMPASLFSRSMPLRLTTFSNGCSKPPRANFTCCVIP